MSIIHSLELLFFLSGLLLQDRVPAWRGGEYGSFLIASTASLFPLKLKSITIQVFVDLFID